jgi:hypothetical protein
MLDPHEKNRAPDVERGVAREKGEPDFADLIDDQRARWRRGEPVAVEEILEQNPSLRARDDTILDLIYNEVVLRAEVGERPELDEYKRRFPRWAPQLAVQFEGQRVVLRSTIVETEPPDDASKFQFRTFRGGSVALRGSISTRQSRGDPLWRARMFGRSPSQPARLRSSVSWATQVSMRDCLGTSVSVFSS